LVFGSSRTATTSVFTVFFTVFFIRTPFTVVDSVYVYVYTRRTTDGQGVTT
jgi:hypothetical protein